ncbi:MAG: tRNA-dihydrouridine synthase [Deltaproteobacteria bacterium]|nr:tRNA-dihydrouridine synthase [Deltaproteobacteria bacterium]
MTGPRIGSLTLANPLVLAPMAGLTNWPFRRLAKACGAALTVTEMVSSQSLSSRGAKTLKLLKTDPRIEKPFCVQLFGKDPVLMAQAARIAEDLGADIIDLNLACPARKVIRSGHGAALLKDFPLAFKLVRAAAEAVRIPVTVKTRPRFGPGFPDIFQLAPLLAEAGAAAVTVHGREAVQGFAGEADWEIVRRLAAECPIPVFGSGDLVTPEDIVRKLRDIKCAGVFIGRGAKGRPWIFRQALELLAGRRPAKVTLEERFLTARTHAQWLQEEIGNRAAFMLRSVLMWYTKYLPQAAAIRRAICLEENIGRQLAILEEGFQAALDQGAGDDLFDGEDQPEGREPAEELEPFPAEDRA